MFDLTQSSPWQIGRKYASSGLPVRQRTKPFSLEFWSQAVSVDLVEESRADVSANGIVPRGVAVDLSAAVMAALEATA
jgi:hypothetical protein